MKVKLILFVLLITLPAVFTNAQQVIKIDNAAEDLNKQFESAFSQSKSFDGFWIGYSIQRNDSREVSENCYYFDESFNLPSLKDIISNPQAYNAKQMTLKTNKHSRRSFIMKNGISIDNGTTQKESGFLFFYDKTSKSITSPVEISICSTSRYFDLNGYPLFWLGDQNTKMSLDFLTGFYNKTKELKIKKETIPAIAVHNRQPGTTSFLIGIIKSKSDSELRNNSVFWLGFQSNNEAFNELKSLISKEASMKIRKSAVVSLGFMDMPAALDELIYIAKHNEAEELRKHAVYGLSNKAVKQAEDALKDIVENDPDIEIKKHAVYALANGSKNIIPYLIHIAKTNSSLAVRKSAIYSLGNIDDEKAVDALIDLAKNR